jgi:hypothetical protein
MVINEELDRRSEPTKHRRCRFSRISVIAVAILMAAIVGGLVFPRSRGANEIPEKTDPRAFVPETTVKYLMSCGIEFRMQAAVDFELAVKNFHAEPAFDFITQNKMFAKTPLAWEYFFSAAVTIMGNYNGPAYVIAYYNPFLDVAILTRWTMDSKQIAKIAAASVRSGTELSGRPANSEASGPRWMASDDAMPIALRNQYASFMATFTETFPPDGQADWTAHAKTSAKSLEQIMAQASTTMLMLYAFQNRVDKSVVAMLAEFRTALYDGDTESLGRFLTDESGMSATEVADLPEQFRQEMVGLFAVGAADEITLVMADPKVLQFCALLSYKITPPGKIVAFNLFDMGSQESASPTGSSTKGINL